MNHMQTVTIPAPSDRNKPLATPSALAFTRSGTIGFDAYLAAVLEAERERAERMMKGKCL